MRSGPPRATGASITLSPAADPLFLAWWCTGPDPVHDGVFFVEALSCAGKGPPQALIPPTWLRPYAELDLDAPVSRRMYELGYPRDRSAEPAPARQMLPELLSRLGGRPLVLAGDRRGFLDRFRNCLPGVPEPPVVDLEALAALLHPHRGGRAYQDLSRRFLGETPPSVPRAAHLRRLCAALIAAHFARPAEMRQLFARVYDQLAGSAAAAGEEEARSWLELLRHWLDRPSGYAADPDPLLYAELPSDGAFAADLEHAPLEADLLLSEIEPLFSAEYQRRFAAFEPLPVRPKTAAVPAGEKLDGVLRLLNGYFDLLPRSFAAAEPAQPERPGQRALGLAVWKALEEDALLIADAPTGTGKTLAYLAPVLLWAVHHQVRAGVSTYTRTLQEQAYFREVPRAVELLLRAGLPAERAPRISMIKGRGNYLCGRALRESLPDAGAAPAAWATWLRLALYYCEDPSGDLDGFGLEPGPPLASVPRTLRAARAVMEAARALPDCCVGRAAAACAAGVRRLRAERSHLVITNHALVLSQPEQLASVVFDECDHLHEVAAAAQSVEIDLEEVHAGTVRLRGEGREGGLLPRLDRLLERLPPGAVSPALPAAARDAQLGCTRIDAAQTLVERELRGYRTRKAAAEPSQSPEQRALYFAHYLGQVEGAELKQALHELQLALQALEAALRAAADELAATPRRAARRVRWEMRRAVENAAEWREGLSAFLAALSPPAPPEDGVEQRPGAPRYLHELAASPPEERRRRPVLALRCLLPQQWLAESCFPGLRGAAFVSATARLQGDFAAMKTYLGLDLVADAAAPERRRALAEYAAPPTFDPRAALYCVPADAPVFGAGGDAWRAWLDYVEDFLLFLATRTGGRTLGLFTNRQAVLQAGERLAPAFAAGGIPFFWQGMPGLSKEEISERFRARVDSVLLGLDTFWYGVDFPGETCQYVVLTKLPFGALDDYYHAQRASMGAGAHRQRVYLPRALAMFRQGCGRLLRSEHDRGVVFVLDRRILERRHGYFLRELFGDAAGAAAERLCVAGADECLRRAFAHMRISAELQRRGLAGDFSSWRAAKTIAEP